VFTAAGIAAMQVWDMGYRIIEFLYKLFTFQISLKLVGGPLFIAKMAGQAARAGIDAVIWLMIFLSVNLAVVNLMPIPVLDGGHLLFIIIEKIRGKALSLKSRAIAQQVGLIFLLAFITIITYNDILR
jgi:regulator of sigma E protease